MRQILQNYSHAKFLNALQRLSIPPEPAVLSLKNVKTVPTFTEESGCRLYSYVKEEHVPISFYKEVTETLFFREFNTAESTNLYSLLISILLRCEKLGFSHEQIGSAIILLCGEIMKEFKTTMVSLSSQGSKDMIESMLDQTSEQQEMEEIFKKLKIMRRNPDGSQTIRDLLRQLKIHYYNFYSIKSPEVKNAGENLKLAEELSLSNILDFSSPSALSAIRRENASFQEKTGKNPTHATLLSYLEALEINNPDLKLTQPLGLKSTLFKKTK